MNHIMIFFISSLIAINSNAMDDAFFFIEMPDGKTIAIPQEIYTDELHRQILIDWANNANNISQDDIDNVNLCKIISSKMSQYSTYAFGGVNCTIWLLSSQLFPEAVWTSRLLLAMGAGSIIARLAYDSADSLHTDLSSQKQEALAILRRYPTDDANTND